MCEQANFSAYRNDVSDGMFMGMSKANRPVCQAQLGGKPGRRSVQSNLGFTPLVRHDFDLHPLDIADPRAEGFGDGFFGRKPRRQRRVSTLAVSAFSLSEEPLVKPLAVAQRGALYPFHLNDINASSKHIGNSILYWTFDI